MAHYIEVTIDPDGNPDSPRYSAELDAWWTARNAERKADANG